MGPRFLWISFSDTTSAVWRAFGCREHNESQFSLNPSSNLLFRLLFLDLFERSEYIFLISVSLLFLYLQTLAHTRRSIDTYSVESNKIPVWITFCLIWKTNFLSSQKFVQLTKRFAHIPKRRLVWFNCISQFIVSMRLRALRTRKHRFPRAWSHSIAIIRQRPLSRIELHELYLRNDKDNPGGVPGCIYLLHVRPRMISLLNDSRNRVVGFYEPRVRGHRRFWLRIRSTVRAPLYNEFVKIHDKKKKPVVDTAVYSVF